jgi:tRNA U34 5-methylaminomethyl-2-thiouridine-forming methyltransferase MnmC
MSDIKIINTSDGSQSLFIKSLNETYHSTHGALNESRHVFIDNGLNDWFSQSNKKQIRILEVGFGTGLNALLTWVYAKSYSDIQIDYLTLEPFPLKPEVYHELTYHSLIPEIEQSELLSLHQSDFGHKNDYGNFCFRKECITLQSFREDQLDLIYFDAFAPNKQMEMWNLEVFERLFDQLNTGGVLVTYCAQGQFKRNLKKAGFIVQTLPGPPGKKEMVRAIRNT